MKAAVLGSGLMGSVIAQDLATSSGVASVDVLDIDRGKLRVLKERLRSPRVTTVSLDLSNVDSTSDRLRGYDVVVSALPHGVVHSADLAAVRAGAKLVNIAFEDEQMRLDREAKRTGAMLIPGCGLAPGLGGILLADGVSRVRGADEGHILVGGVPQNPRPPFEYELLFSIVGLLREFTDDARVYRKGRLVRVKPFDKVEIVDLPPPAGRMEAFCTDGLASLVYTMKGLRTLDEKTLRWPGHVSKMKVMMDAGYFSTEKLKVRGFELTPLEMSWHVLEKSLSASEPKDMTVMRVEAMSSREELLIDLIDKYDEEKMVTSMGRTTGYTASIVAQMVGDGTIQGSGVLPPETAVRGELTERLVGELRRRGVAIKETRRTRKGRRQGAPQRPRATS